VHVSARRMIVTAASIKEIEEGKKERSQSSDHHRGKTEYNLACVIVLVAFVSSQHPAHTHLRI